MSEKKFEPVKRFLSINRGNDLPNGIVVIRKADSEFSATHASYQQAKLDLQYKAKQVGANGLLDVYVTYYQNYGTTYTAFGVPAVLARESGKRTVTEEELWNKLQIPPPPPPPPPPPKKEPNLEFWSFLVKFVGYTCLVIGFLWFLNHS